jgi:hypothetical protein
MNQRLTFQLVLAFALLLARPVLGLEHSINEGKMCVLVLEGKSQADDAAKIAREIQKRLEGQSRAISVNMMIRSLGICGPATMDLERMRGVYQQGYLQSYSFKYRAAILSFRAVLDGLRTTPDSLGRWELWMQTNLHLAKAYIDSGKKKAARQAFLRVARTRPFIELSRKEFSPKVIKGWNAAKESLTTVSRGDLEVKSDPPGAEVFLDGTQVSETPFKMKMPCGKYHMRVTKSGLGTSTRWVKILKKGTKVAVKLDFEGAINLNLAHPSIRIPEGSETLPKHWWPWLGSKLSVDRFIAVRQTTTDNQSRYVASLIDGKSGRILREGWLEPSGNEKEHIAADAVDLSTFLTTGESGKRVVMTVPAKKVKEEKPGKPQPTAAKETRPPKPVPFKSTSKLTDVSQPRPWYRKFWPYALGGAVLAGGGVGCHLYSSDLRDSADGNKSKEEASDAWLGVAIGGYVAAGAMVVTGIIIAVTFEDNPQESAVIPTIGQDCYGLQIIGRF